MKSRSKSVRSPAPRLALISLLTVFSLLGNLGVAAAGHLPGQTRSEAILADLAQSWVDGQQSLLVVGTESQTRLDQAKYPAGGNGCLRVTVTDPDENTDPAVAEKASVDVVDTYPVATATGDRETLELTETGADTGVFVRGACLPIETKAATENDGILQVQPGDFITALYQDPDNPSSVNGEDELFAKVDMSADLALISGGQAQGDFTITIDPDILSKDLQTTPGQSEGEPDRPVGMVLNPEGVPHIYGADQILLQVTDQQDLGMFEQQYGGMVVDQFTIGAADQGAGEGEPYALVRINTASADLGDFAYLAETFGSTGEHVFSSQQAAELMAILLEEQLGGRPVSLNSILISLGRPVTNEGGADGFDQAWFDQPDIGLREGIVYLDLIDRNPASSVNVAVVDGGFASPDDYEVGDPLRGVENPDFGLPFTSIPQGDCNAADCTGPADGPYPVMGFCAGGDSPACDWHGTLVYSILGAVADNGAGTMGVAGHARTPTGADGVQGLASPIFLKVGLPYMSNAAKAINAAVDQNAEVINVSGGFACEPVLDMDLCRSETRFAILAACAILGSALSFLIPPPIAVLLTGLSCGGLEAFFHLVGFAHEDALERAVNRALADPQTVLVASGPENVNIPVLGEMGPFDAVDVEFLPCTYGGVTCVGFVQDQPAPAPHPANIFGPGIDIWAPGPALFPAQVPGSGSTFQSLGGTSAAAPFISGVVTMLKAADPSLTRGEIETILNRTSNPWSAGTPAGACIPHASLAGCVGFVDVLAALQDATGEVLSCTGFDEPSAVDPGDNPSTAPLVSLPFATTGADRSIHALPADEDWYAFEVPALGASSTEVEVSLTFPTSHGQLAFELYRLSAAPGNLVFRGSGSRLTFRGLLLSGETHYVKVEADTPAYLNDNCYGGSTLRIEALGPGPDADRFEVNDSLGSAAPLGSSGWLHEPLNLRIFEDGDVAMRTTSAVWTRRITGLSLHAPGDIDFYSLPLPDPADRYPDIDPDPGITEPLSDSGLTYRIGFGGDSVEIQIDGYLSILVEVDGVLVGQRVIDVYRDGARDDSLPTGTALKKLITSPRSLYDYTDAVFAFGRQVDSGPYLPANYDLVLEYKINVVRDVPDWLNALREREEVAAIGGMPCPGGFFPGCDGSGLPPISIFDLGHPASPLPDPVCVADGPGCQDYFLFEWPQAGAFAMSFAASNDLAFTLFDEQQNIIGQASGVPLASGQIQATAKELKVDELAPGLYVLEVDGTEGTYTVTTPAQPKYKVYLPQISR
jgi:hypothetical protein